MKPRISASKFRRTRKRPNLFGWKIRAEANCSITRGGDNLIEPFQKPLISAEIKIEIDGTEITLNQPVEYRFAADVCGEVRRELKVVPKLSLTFDQNLLVVPNSGKQQIRQMSLSVVNNSSTEATGEAKLDLPKELKVSLTSTSFNLRKKGEKASLSCSYAFFRQLPAGVPGAYRIFANLLSLK